MQKRKRLAPCPKCGKNDKRTFKEKHFFEIGYKVRCLSCGFEIDSFDNKETAHEVWNALISGRRNGTK